MSASDNDQPDTSQSAGASGQSGKSADSLILSEPKSLRFSVDASMNDISDRVDRLSETVYGSSATQKRKPAESGYRSWANILQVAFCISTRFGLSDKDDNENPGPGFIELA